MGETVCIPRKEYEDLIRSRYNAESKDEFNFDNVFAIGNGKLNAQNVKNMLRKEW